MTLVRPGARAPFCYGMSTNRTFYSFDAQAGRAAVVIVADGIAQDVLRAMIGGFVQQSSAFAAWNADIVLLGNEDVVRQLDAVVPAFAGIQFIDCSSGVLTERGIVFVVDRNLRVAMRSDATAFVVSACLRCVEALPREAPCDVLMPAPVLLLPNLLSRSMCDALIERFESGASVDGGIASVDRDGRPCTKVDHSKKQRRDMIVAPDDPLHDHLRADLLEFCAPEMAKAFHVSIRHIDRLLIVRYDSPAGKFLRHRDNRGKNVAFREFALSVNLRREAHDGGHLLFPEYNDHHYSPPTGAGVIFSSSLLHEATEVTRGRRYVLLTFLHGDAAEARRLAYEAEMVGIG